MQSEMPGLWCSSSVKMQTNLSRSDVRWSEPFIR